ncbi:uncharacterized protein BKCO1_9000155 [Diplodia corticola]|uniref:RNase H type-1 domain-containing protein n=1 Tax=Diplodia corticola TaxID=236234 RepID=A0A1J9RWA0_9PEZI|nr:uncharacterized protein BKCO1_9000155 [Diplodia corticola]OJD36899.1 hypothetical protein BKCO1_9000155 [Diplodia corticola]
MPSSQVVYTVDGVWCVDSTMAVMNSKEDLEVKNWTGDFTKDAPLDYQVILRPSVSDRVRASRHYHSIADEDLLVLSTDGSVAERGKRGGWAAIQSAPGDRLIHFTSGSMTWAERPPWAIVPWEDEKKVRSGEMELRAASEALEKAVEMIVQRRAQRKSTWKTIVVLSDCELVLKSVGRYRLSAGQTRVYEYCNISILQSRETLNKYGVGCVFEMTKGHSDVAPNVAADMVAGAQSGCKSWRRVRRWRNPHGGNPIEELPSPTR